jgi:integrase
MSGKQAKILAANHIDDLLLFAETTRYPIRDRVIVLLSVKAGLRAAEIANLTWDMVLDPEGGVCASLELRDSAAKMGHGRVIPLHSDLRDALKAHNRVANFRTTCRPVRARQPDEGPKYRHLVQSSLSRHRT